MWRYVQPDLMLISIVIMLFLSEEFYIKLHQKLLDNEFSLIMTDISQHETLVAPTLEKGKRKQVMIWFLCQAIIFDITKSSFKIFSPYNNTLLLYFLFTLSYNQFKKSLWDLDMQIFIRLWLEHDICGAIGEMNLPNSSNT